MAWYDTLVDIGTSLWDAGTDALSEPSTWTDIIGSGIEYYGAQQQVEAGQEAAQQVAQSMQQAARPRSVFDPLSQAVYDPTTESYQLTVSPELQALQRGLFADAMRQRQEIEPFMTRGGFESEVARRSREEQKLIEDATREALQSAQGKLVKKGTLGTTMGAGALAEVAKRGAEAKVAAQQAQRGLLSGEITDYLNRAAAARQGMLGIGQQPQAAAELGMGLSSSALKAAAGAANPYLAAQTTAASTAAQPYYQLGGFLSSALSTPTQTTTPQYSPALSSPQSAVDLLQQSWRG